MNSPDDARMRRASLPAARVAVVLISLLAAPVAAQDRGSLPADGADIVPPRVAVLAYVWPEFWMEVAARPDPEETGLAVPARSVDLLPDTLSALVHAAFLRFQRRTWEEAGVDTIFLPPAAGVDRSDTLSTPSLKKVEAGLLADALRRTRADSLHLRVRQYLAVRALRGERESLIAERRDERLEGTATYVGCAVAAAPGDSCVLSVLLAPPLVEASAADSVLRHLSGTGAAMSLLLDRIGVPDWHEMVAVGDFLDAILTAAVDFDPERDSYLVGPALEAFPEAESLDLSLQRKP